MAHGSSTAAIVKAVRSIMMEIYIDHLHCHPNTKNVNHIEEKLAKACGAVHTTSWKVQHVCLPLALSDSALARATNYMLTSSDLPLPYKINKEVNDITSAF